MDVENTNLGFSVLNIFKKSSNKRSKVSDCITVIGVTQAMLIGKIRINWISSLSFPIPTIFNSVTLFSGLLSADKEDENVSDDDQKNTNQQSRAKLVRQSFVDDDRGFPHSFSEQSKSRSSFASSDFYSVSLKSSSLQVDDIIY
jgi:hypothetical protein